MALSNEDLDRLKSWAAIASSVAIPVVLAVVGYLLNRSIANDGLKKDYVQIAVTILKENAATQEPDLRKWAVQVLDENAPVPFNNKAKDSLLLGPSPRNLWKIAPQTCVTDIKVPRGIQIVFEFDEKHRRGNRIVAPARDMDLLVKDLIEESVVGEVNTAKLNCLVSWMKDIDRMQVDPAFANEMRMKAEAIRAARSAAAAASR